MLLQAELDLLAGAQEMEPIKTFIGQALSGKASGETLYYDNICKQLRERDDQEVLWKVIICLSSFVTTFARDADSSNRYSELIEAILSYDWRCDRKVSIAFVNLLGHMVSTNATHLEACFRVLVSRLAPTEWEISNDAAIATDGVSPMITNALRSGSELGDAASVGCSTAENIRAATAESTPSSGDVPTNRSNGKSGGMMQLPPMPGYEVADQTRADLEVACVEDLRARTFRIHRTLHSLMHLVPSGQRKLFKILAESFPHKRFGKEIIATYVSQLLYMCEYIPSIQPMILDLVLQRALELDVEIIIEDSGEARVQEDYQGEDETALFHLEGDHVDTPSIAHASKGGAVRTGKYENSYRIQDDVTEMADKLDTVLLLLVSFIDRQLRKDAPHKERLYVQLLSIFEERVLFTYRSKFVQFVYFYLGCRVERFATAFCQRLLRVFLEETGQSSMKLQSAVLYLASFMARANFVPVGLVGDALSSLLEFANNYITQVGADTPYSRSLRGRENAQVGRESFNLQSVASTIANSASLNDLSNVVNTSESDPPLHQDHPRNRGGGGEVIYTEFDDMGRRTSAAVAATLSRHETFFCCMQAASYVLCFYGTDLADSIVADNTKRRHWERAMTCELNPLKYCLESVRGEFIRLAQTSALFAPECWRMLPGASADEPANIANKGSIGLYGRQESSETDEDRRSRSTSVISSAGVTSDSAGAGTHSVIAAVVTIPMEQVARTSDAVKQKEPARSSENASDPAGHLVSPRSAAIAVKSKGGSPAAEKSVSDKVPIMGTGNNPLESFFPFDPCLLRKMHRCIDGSYRTWKGVPGLDPGAEFDYEHDDRVYSANGTTSYDYDSDCDGSSRMEFGGHSQDNSDTLGEALDNKRDRGCTISSEASSSAASYSASADGMVLSTTPGAISTSTYGNSYLAELAQGGSGTGGGHATSQGIAFNDSSDGSHRGAGGRGLTREGMPRHGSQTSQISNVSHNESDRSVGGDNDGQVNSPEGAWPPPKPRPRLYSVGSTGSW